VAMPLIQPLSLNGLIFSIIILGLLAGYGDRNRKPGFFGLNWGLNAIVFRHWFFFLYLILL